MQQLWIIIAAFIITLPAILLGVRQLESGLTLTDIVLAILISCIPIANVLLAILILCEGAKGKKFFVPKKD